MKKFLYVLLLSISVLMLSCRTTKECVSVSAKSETVATIADRLCSSLMTDSNSHWFMLSADSMVFRFDDSCPTQEGIRPIPDSGKESKTPRDEAKASVLDDLYFLSVKPPEQNTMEKGSSGWKAVTGQQPKVVRVYGLHIDAGDKEKSSVQSSAKYSKSVGSQSSVAEAKEARKSAPSKALMCIFYILIIACAFLGCYRIKKWLGNR